MRLKEKTAIITGAAQGIGRAIAAQLALEGAFVVIADRDSALGEQTAQALRDQGQQAVFAPTDVTRFENVQAAVDTALRERGRLDIFVNNAGIIIRDSVLDTQPDDWQRVFAVNVNGTYHGTVAAAKAMITSGKGGYILNVTSPNGILGLHQRSCYAATKGAVMAYTRCCATELAPHGIQVNGLAPGFTNTEINAAFISAPIQKALAFRLPMGRIAQPVEIGRAAAALVSGDFSYMTGQIVYVDGGWSSSDVNYQHLGDTLE
jgi:NAD(P)-dependent dehydrogenase (short-subunit alcohol dehydrogenase family)